MIFDESAVRNMAQQAADSSNTPQEVYRRKTGEYMFCSAGNLNFMRKYLGTTEQITYLYRVKPSNWPEDK